MGDLAQIRTDPIGSLMPWTEGEERNLRNRLLRAQQYSANRALHSTSKTASGLFWLINSTAAAYATAPVSPSAGSTCEDLRDLLAGLNRLAVVADMFERRETADG